MADIDQGRIDAFFALFGEDAEVEARIEHVTKLGKNWEPSYAESAELGSYDEDAGQIVIDNIARFLSDGKAYIQKCGKVLGDLLRQLDSQENAADEQQPESTKVLRALDAENLPIAKPEKPVLVPAAVEGNVQNGKNDRGQGNKRDHSNNRRGPANETPIPPLPDPEPPKVIKPKTVAELLNLSSHLPDPVVRLLQTTDWHDARMAIEEAFVQSRDKDTKSQGEARATIAAWIRRMGMYRNGFAGDEKRIFGHYMTACIGKLELGVDTGSIEYQFEFVIGVKPKENES